MSDSDIQPIVSKEWSLMRLVILMILFFGVGAGVLATLTFRDIRGKASIAAPSPTPLLTSPIPSAKTTLEAPYVRLVSYKDSYAYRTSVPIDVYLDTANLPTAEAEIVLSYDPNFLEITEKNVTIESVYKSADVTLSDTGKITISLFVNPELGHQPVTLSKETKIAGLRFMTKSLTAEEAKISVEYEKDATDATSLYRFTAERAPSPVNLLQSVEGVTLTISP